MSSPEGRARQPALVRVHGRVLRSGVPAAGYELSFHAAAGSWRDPTVDWAVDRAVGRAVDWGLTDRAGRYEVELPHDRYVVRFQDGGDWPGTVLVLPGDDELVVDFELLP